MFVNPEIFPRELHISPRDLGRIFTEVSKFASFFCFEIFIHAFYLHSGISSLEGIECDQGYSLAVHSGLDAEEMPVHPCSWPKHSVGKVRRGNVNIHDAIIKSLMMIFPTCASSANLARQARQQ